MASALTAEQNAYARALLRELYAKLGNQRLVAERVGLEQSAVSRLTKAGSTQGTTPDVLLKAAKELRKPRAEVESVMGMTNDNIIPSTYPAALAEVLRGRRFDSDVIECAVRYVERDGREFSASYWIWLLERMSMLFDDAELRKKLEAP